MTRRGVAATAVLAAWAGGMALLFARELNPSSAARLAEAALRVTPITTYYIVERSGRHAGFASISIDTVPHSLQVSEYMVTESPGGQRQTDLLTVRLSRALSLREYVSASARNGDSTHVAGQVIDSTLVITSVAGSSRIAFSQPAFPGAIRGTVSMLLGEPRVGATSTIRTIDPGTGTAGPRTMRVLAESLFVVVDSAVADSTGRWFAVHRDTVRAWRLVADGTPLFDAWIDAQGLIVESRLASGLTLRRTAFELAFENWRRADPGRAVAARGDGRVVSGTWLASGAERPTEVLDSLRVRFGTPIPSEFASRYGRYYRPGGLVTFGRIPDERLKSRYTLPTPEKWRRFFARELAPGPGIESEDPVVARRARRLAGDERDPAAITRRIVEWVHDSLRGKPGSATGSANALERMSGDAREFALVTTALARAIGIPAHPVSGLLQHEGTFYLHSWTEVYLGRWIPVDAMLGQFPADASHLSFVSGVADPGPDLARILARLPISVVGAVRARR